MFDARKILIIFLVGVLYAIFSYSLIDAIYPGPEYEDYCARMMVPVPSPLRAEPINCSKIEQPICEKGGNYYYEYDSQGCPTKVTCDYCQRDYDAAKEKHNLKFFILASILGLIAIAIGLLLPQKKDISEWIATGFLLGGLITIFIG
ncbi:MAG: hypothetical protein QW666_00005, partial [Candidatus Woesearchaeota archaeon]